MIFSQFKQAAALAVLSSMLNELLTSLWFESKKTTAVRLSSHCPARRPLWNMGRPFDGLPLICRLFQDGICWKFSFLCFYGKCILREGAGEVGC
jgi:hypothetical protein